MFIITIDELKSNLQGSSPVEFTYFKSDGTSRNAKGTLFPSLIPEKFQPKDSSLSEDPPKRKNLRYFDLDKMNWRSLKSDSKIVSLFE